MSLGNQTLSWGVQFEWPDEVVCLLEVFTTSVNFVNQILHANKSEGSEILFNEFIVLELDSLSVNLSISSLVQKGGDCLL